MPPETYDHSNVESPCIKVCVLDPTRRFCVGCYRTPAEIGRWRDAPPEEKERIKEAADKRARAAGVLTD